MKYCPYCGAGLNEDMLFCPKCGKRFEGEKENPHLTEEERSAASPVSPAPTVTEALQPPKKKKGWLIAVIAVALIAAVLGVLFASGAFQPEPEPTPEPLRFSDDPAAIAAASNSVVMLTCYDKNGEPYASGSGFAVFDDGVIVTNYHVIKDEVYSVQAQTESGGSFGCNTVLAYDVEKDIAILQADSETGLTLLTPGSTEDLQKGEKVVAIGSPLGLINSVSTGVFSGYIDDSAGRVLQFTAPISHGSSGGALFNDDGEVIGITFASLEAGQSLNLGVPIEDAAELYAAARPADAMTMAAFYDSFEHVPPIPTYTVDYVCSHPDELDGREICVEGYVSSREDELWSNPNYSFLYIVSSSDEVYGKVREVKDLIKYDTSHDANRFRKGQGLISVSCADNNNLLSNVIPGDYVIIKGVVFVEKENNRPYDICFFHASSILLEKNVAE